MPKLIVTDFNEPKNSREMIGEVFHILTEIAQTYGVDFVHENIDELLQGKVCKIEPTSGYRVHVSIWR